MLRTAISNVKEHLSAMSPPDDFVIVAAAAGVAPSSLAPTSEAAFGSIDVAAPTVRRPATPATSVASLAVEADTRVAPQSPSQGTATE